MTKHFDLIEGGRRRRISLPINPDIQSGAPSKIRRNGIADPWRVAQRALDLLAHSRRTIIEQEEQIAQLKSLSETDELTGLLNRRGLLKTARRVLDMAARHGETGAFCYIDLDGFKATNDRYGHEAGDAVLCHLATTLRTFLRGTDIFARLGGDEFVVILVHADKSAAADRAKALQELINSLQLRHHNQAIAIRGTIGMSLYGPDSKVEQLLQHADEKMYREKVRRREA